MKVEQLRKPSFGPSYKDRIAESRKFLHEQELKYSNGERLYGWIDGVHFLNKQVGELGYIQIATLIHIRHLINTNKGNKPIIYLDIGGGFGEASMAIAAALHNEIDTGKVLMLVSNLEFIPTPQYIPRMLKNTELHQYFRQNMHRICYIQSDVPHLANLKLNTNIGSLRLLGSVDFIHEFNALTHSRTPDIDYWVLGRLLSQRGTLMFDSENVYSDMEVSDNLKRDISTSFQCGINNLRQMGLRESRLTDYYVFSRPAAPLLSEQ